MIDLLPQAVLMLSSVVLGYTLRTLLDPFFQRRRRQRRKLRAL